MDDESGDEEEELDADNGEQRGLRSLAGKGIAVGGRKGKVDQVVFEVVRKINAINPQTRTYTPPTRHTLPYPDIPENPSRFGQSDNTPPHPPTQPLAPAPTCLALSLRHTSPRAPNGPLFHRLAPFPTFPPLAVPRSCLSSQKGNCRYKSGTSHWDPAKSPVRPFLPSRVPLLTRSVRSKSSPSHPPRVLLSCCLYC